MVDDPRAQSFLGTGWGFPPEFEPGRGVIMVSDEDDVAQSLKILFQTARGERMFQPKYGLHLGEHLFEALNTTAKTLLEDQIRIAIAIHEPRITMLGLFIDTRKQHEGQVDILLDYAIRSTNSRFNMVIPFHASGAQPAGSERRDG